MSEIFDRYHKRLTESIHADDVAPRLVQSAILSHEDLSNIRLQTSNTRAMKVTLAKLAGLAARGAAGWSNWTRRRLLVKLDAAPLAGQAACAFVIQMVLHLVLQKGGKAFDVFCDTIKFKYKGIYNILMDAKKSPSTITRPGNHAQAALTLTALTPSLGS